MYMHLPSYNLKYTVYVESTEPQVVFGEIVNESFRFLHACMGHGAHRLCFCILWTRYLAVRWLSYTLDEISRGQMAFIYSGRDISRSNGFHILWTRYFAHRSCFHTVSPRYLAHSFCLPILWTRYPVHRFCFRTLSMRYLTKLWVKCIPFLLDWKVKLRTDIIKSFQLSWRLYAFFTLELVSWQEEDIARNVKMSDVYSP
jgi:hypothetical protein